MNWAGLEPLPAPRRISSMYSMPWCSIAGTRRASGEGKVSMSSDRLARITPLFVALVLAIPALVTSSASAQDATPADPTTAKFKLVEVLTGLNQPVDLVDPDDGSQRLFIV